VEAVGSPRHSPGFGEPARALRVAQVITKLSAGAGGVALHGALALDRQAYATTIFTSEGGTLTDDARAAGVEVIELRHLSKGRGIYPGDDRRAFRELVPELFHGFPFHAFQPAPVRRGLIAIERRLARLTDFFLAAGTMVAAEAVRLRLAPPDRILAIDPPIATGIPPVSSATRRHARRLLGVPDDAAIVGTVARLDGQKAPLDMVRAIAALGRDDLLMIWVGDGPMREATERTDRFLLLGQRRDVSAILPAFDVFVLSSLFEGLPCSAVEAMTCGVPVVATAVNSVPELVVSGKTGLLARPKAPDSLARAIRYVLDHPDEGARMAAAARAHVGDRFWPDAHALDLVHAYGQALRHASERNAARATMAG
jgi:glycosyltransferase involved in cell wall biosynthesis